jgi:hypothetical protein
MIWVPPVWTVKKVQTMVLSMMLASTSVKKHWSKVGLI